VARVWRGALIFIILLCVFRFFLPSASANTAVWIAIPFLGVRDFAVSQSSTLFAYMTDRDFFFPNRIAELEKKSPPEILRLLALYFGWRSVGVPIISRPPISAYDTLSYLFMVPDRPWHGRGLSGQCHRQ